MEIKVSIILPIYNAGSHLEKCLDTLVNQTLKEIEIIAILDCPTDGSDKIIEKYASFDERIKIIYNKENLHIGESRNAGIRIANGEFIGFSDHDDYRELEMYSLLYNFAKFNANSDIVFSPITNIKKNVLETFNIPNINEENCRNFVLSDLIGRGNYLNDVSIFCNIHNAIYKSELIKKNKLKFVDTKKIAPEDVLFNLMSVYYSKQTTILNKPLYYHLLYEISEGHNYEYTGWKKRCEGLNKMYEFLTTNHCYEQYQVEFYIHVTKQILNSLLSIIIQNHNIKEFLHAHNEVKKYPFVKDAFLHYSLFNTNISCVKRFLRRILAKSLTKKKCFH